MTESQVAKDGVDAGHSQEELVRQIVQRCLDMDLLARDSYRLFAKHAGTAELEGFWEKSASEEIAHIRYWRRLLDHASAHPLPSFFDDPQKTLAELHRNVEDARALLADSPALEDVRVVFQIACRLEFYLLHPAFEALFRLFGDLADVGSPSDDYDVHLAEFIAGYRDHIPSSPETRLVGDFLQQLYDTNVRLAQRLGQLRDLRGMIPICASCKSVRDDAGFWSRIEEYMSEHSQAEFSHGLCPDCAGKLYPDIPTTETD